MPETAVLLEWSQCHPVKWLSSQQVDRTCDFFSLVTWSQHLSSRGTKISWWVQPASVSIYEVCSFRCCLHWHVELGKRWCVEMRLYFSLKFGHSRRSEWGSVVVAHSSAELLLGVVGRVTGLTSSRQVLRLFLPEDYKWKCTGARDLSWLSPTLSAGACM